MALRTIVVGADDSEGSRKALAWTCELAADTGARVIAVNVFEPLAHLGRLAPGIDLAKLRAEAQQRLESNLCGDLVAQGVEHVALVREGDPATVLADEAEEAGADLIVVGARRQGRLRGLVLGSTSRRLAEIARVPVTIIRPPDPGAKV